MISIKKVLSGFGKAIPAGCIQAYAGSTVPDGWLECNGQAVSRTNYSNLFSAIGTTYGSGDGSTTFNVPNLQGRFPQGSGTLGSETYTVGENVDAGLPNITGSISADPTTGYIRLRGSGAFYEAGSAYWGVTSSVSGMVTPNAIFDASRSSSIYGNSTTVQPNSVVVKYIIWGGSI